MISADSQTGRLLFDQESIKTPESTTANGGRGGRKILGKIDGRRVIRQGDQLIIQNTPQGRALATLLTGTTCRPGKSKQITIDLARCKESASEILSLLMAIAAETDEESPVETYLRENEILAAKTLSRDPWITLERAQAWREWCSDPENISESVNWRAIFVIKLRDHVEPPLTGIEKKLFEVYGSAWRDHPGAPKTDRERTVFQYFGKSWFDYQDSI